MRIMHVVGSMATGGAETVVATLCRIHRKEGHEPSIQALGVGGRLSREMEAEGIPIALHQDAERKSVTRRIRDLSRTIQQVRPDIVHCHSPGPTILGTVAARLAGTRSIVATRHDQVRGRLQLRRRLLFRGAARLCYRLVTVSADANVHLSASLGSLAGRIITIPNGAAPAPGGDTAEPESPRKSFTLITVGRLVECKDHVRLLEAVAIAREQLPELKLLIVGGGEEEANLRRRRAQLSLDNEVELLGEKGDVGNWLERADLFVMNSLTEGLPVALLEALHAGVPQVVTDVGGMPEVVNMADSGLVVPPARPDLLAEAIVSLANRPDERRRLAANSRVCYEKTFSPDKFAQRYLELYEMCIQETRRS